MPKIFVSDGTSRPANISQAGLAKTGQDQPSASNLRLKAAPSGQGSKSASASRKLASSCTPQSARSSASASAKAS